jgi:hypothetical protein
MVDIIIAISICCDHDSMVEIIMPLVLFVGRDIITIQYDMSNEFDYYKSRVSQQ